MKKIYFTITGTWYYYGPNVLHKKDKVRLIKEPDNKHDSEAIRVEVKGLGKVGYVANSPHTVLGESFSAGRLYDRMDKKAKGTVAAAKGSRQAQENLGYCYYYGRDGEVDYEKAFHYFALGAFDGHLISLYKIGDMYHNGYYVEKNEREAFHIYMHCLDTMTEEYEMDVAGPVSLRLGDMFLNGLGTEANPLSALVSYQKAEVYLYNMVRNGDDMYRKSLMSAIEGQKRARERLELPDKTWTIDG